MSKRQRQNLVQIKRTLAEKYMRLAGVRHSKPAKGRLARKALRYSREAALLGEGLQ